MTLQELMEMAEMIDGVIFDDRGNDEYALTIEDFLGFNDDWSEEFNDDLDEVAIDELLDAMREAAVSVEIGFYSDYQFVGFSVRVGYTSYDI